MKKNLLIIKILLLCMSVLAMDRMAEAQETKVDTSRKFDVFNGSNWESAMAHLDSFVLDLQNNQQVIGVVIVYGGQHRRRGEARAWSTCLNSYLVSRRGIEPKRIVMIDGGYRDDLTVELWETADRKRMPNSEPQVKPKDVRFRKGKPKHLCEI